MRYIYYAYTKEKKVKRGTIDAASPQAAEEALLKKGVQRVLNLKDIQSRNKLERNFPLSLFSVTNRDILDFSREFANLLRAGISIITALELLEKQTRKTALKTVIANIISNLHGGESLSQAISKHPNVFSTTYCAVVKAAEQSGDLHIGLKHMTEHIEKQEDIKKRTMRALTYPAVVILIAIGVSALLVTAVLPPMMGMFESLGADLPLTTRLLVAVTSFIIANKIYILAALVGFPIMVAGYISVPSGKYNIDRLLLKIPIIGQIILKTNLLFFCRTSAILLQAGVQISNALDICTSTIANRRIRAAFTEGGKKLLQGQPFSRAMAATGMFPASSIEALVVGEKTGELESALKNIAGYFERTSNERVNDLISMIEPAFTIAIGLGVGFIAISIITPIYSLPSNLP